MAAMFRSICLGFFMIWLGVAQAGEVAPLQPDEEMRELRSGVAVFADPSGQETIASISALDASRFLPLQRTFSAGYARTVFWFRFTVQREPSAPAAWLLRILPPYLDDLRLYEPDGPGRFRERRAGDLLPFAARELPYRGFVLKLDLPDDMPRTYFLRLQTTSTSVSQLSLWTPAAFNAATQTEYLLFGLYYGALVLMLVHLLFYWRRFRDQAYLYFIASVAAVLMMALGINGFAAQYLFPGQPIASDWLTSAGASLTNALTVLFFLSFLGIRRQATRLFYLYGLTIAVSAIALAGTFTGHYTYVAPWMFLLSLTLIPPTLFFSWRAMRTGQTGGKSIFWGYLVYAVVIGANLLTTLGALPGDALLLYGWQYGMATYVFFMQYAVLAQLRRWELDHMAAQQRALQAETLAQEESDKRQQQSQYLALMTHELKTPLAVIDTAIQALKYLQATPEPDVARRHVRVRQAVAQLNSLVENALAREVAGDSTLTPRLAPVDVFQLVSDQIAAIADPSHCLELDAPPGIVCVADRTLVRIALGNLIENALKYAPPDTPVRVHARLGNKDGAPGTVFKVSNACPDLPSGAASQVFDKYWRGPNSTGTEGIGLGLYLVRAIARAHGGECDCAIAEGRVGFTLWLPDPAP